MKINYIAGSLFVVSGAIILALWMYSGLRQKDSAPVPVISDKQQSTAQPPDFEKSMITVRDAITFLDTRDQKLFTEDNTRQACSILTHDRTKPAIDALVRHIDLQIDTPREGKTKPIIINGTNNNIQKVISEQYVAFMSLLHIGKPATDEVIEKLLQISDETPTMRVYLLEQFLLNVNGRDSAVALLKQKKEAQVDTKASTRYDRTLNELTHIAIDSYQID